MKSINTMKEHEMSSQGPEVVGELICRFMEVRRFKPKYLIEPKHKALLFLMRFMSNTRAEKLVESIYC